MDLGNCRSKKCRAPLLWTLTTNAKRIPLDRDPISHTEAYANPRGVFYLDERGVALSWGPGVMIDADESLYRSHWATCVDQEAFRKNTPRPTGGTTSGRGGR